MQSRRLWVVKGLTSDHETSLEILFRVFLSFADRIEKSLRRVCHQAAKSEICEIKGAVWQIR